MLTADFDYELPQELIAQRPASTRDAARLLVLRRHEATIEHRLFRELPELLERGDLLIHNNSRVLPARVFAKNPRTGGQFEILLLEENSRNDWWVMLKPGKRAHIGTVMEINGADSALTAAVIDINGEGHRRLQFQGCDDVRSQLGRIGKVPLPPYVTRAADEEDAARYQTVYAGAPGSVAAPTAGLHFTTNLLQDLNARGISSHFVTLHVGIGTFAPVNTEKVEHHVMHEERYELPSEAAAAINAAKGADKRVVAVGTTSMRVIETVASEHQGGIVPVQGRTRIFIHPPHTFRIATALLTNFHLPRSTLLMLTSAFAAPGQSTGRDLVMRAYHEAIRERYRFFSYGDAMLIL